MSFLERLRSPTPLPFMRPRHELVLLALVAVSALTPLFVVSVQDSSRLCLTRSIVRGHVTIDECRGTLFIDYAVRRGHLYSDKAPGMSFLAIPAVEAVGLPGPSHWSYVRDWRLWAVRVLTGGLGFLAGAFLLGRMSEGLAPGWGGAVLVTFALGSLATLFAPTTFGHVTAGTFALAAFALAWAQRPVGAGLAAGAAVVCEYQTGAVGLILAGYVALRGARPLLRYAAGAAPPLAVLGAYNQAAFGSPFHLSYRYVTSRFASEQASGFFGIGTPHLHAIHLVLVGNGGLLVVMPVVLAAAGGLVALARSRPAEALVCGLVTLFFLFLEFGYYTPYAGSPVPRFLTPAIPFLLLGLGAAFVRRPVVTSLLSAVSVIAMVSLLLTWASGKAETFRQGVWGELARLPFERGRDPMVNATAKNIATLWTSSSRIDGAVLVGIFATAAWVLGVLRRPSGDPQIAGPRQAREARPEIRSR